MTTVKMVSKQKLLSPNQPPLGDSLIIITINTADLSLTQVQVYNTKEKMTVPRLGADSKYSHSKTKPRSYTINLTQKPNQDQDDLITTLKLDEPETN